MVASLGLNLYQFLRKDHLNGSQLNQVTYAYIARSCHEKIKTERPNLNCAHLEVIEPSFVEGGFIDPNLWSASGVAKDNEGELVWFIEINPTGKVVKSDIMYTDPAGKEIQSSTKDL